MQSFWTSDTLVNRHGISTDSTCVAVMKRAPEMHRIGIDILEQFFSVVLLDTFRMEKLGTVGSRALCQFIFFLAFGRSVLNNLFSIFALTFLALLVLRAIVIAFAPANQALNNVCLTVLAAER